MPQHPFPYLTYWLESHFHNANTDDYTPSCHDPASLFVGVCYLIPGSVRGTARDDPLHIKWRVTTVTLACLLAPLIILSLWGPYDAALLGIKNPLSLHSVLEVVVSLLHNMTLFLGPLLHKCIEYQVMYRPRQKGQWDLNNLQYCFLGDVYMSKPKMWEGFRNFIFAPLAEEFMFRSCMLLLMVHAGFSVTACVCLTPLFFGLAHLHHAMDHIRHLNQASKEYWKDFAIVWVRSLFQMTYTTLFGMYACYVFLRTNNFLAVCCCHAFCNMMGFPSFRFLDNHSPYKDKKMWIIAAFFIGIAGFYLGFHLGVLPTIDSPIWSIISSWEDLNSNNISIVRYVFFWKKALYWQGCTHVFSWPTSKAPTSLWASSCC